MDLLEFMDSVVLYKNRVWTVYSVMTAKGNEGVFAYQGLKPFETFDYNTDSQRFSSFKRNITLIHPCDIRVLEPGEVAAALKKEQRELKKPLTRKKAIDFFVYLTGHSRSFVSKNIDEHYNDNFCFQPGKIRYRLWKAGRGLNGFLILSHNMEGSESHVYYDFLTFETDDLEIEKAWEEVKQEIIDQYKEWKGIE